MLSSKIAQRKSPSQHKCVDLQPVTDCRARRARARNPIFKMMRARERSNSDWDHLFIMALRSVTPGVTKGKRSKIKLIAA